MRKETATFFTGVNAGYQGNEVAVVSPDEAARIVEAELEKIALELGVQNEYRVFSGLVVYGRGRGCPDGGEAVAVVKMTATPEDTLKTAGALLVRLQQSTLTVCFHDAPLGRASCGFALPLTAPLSRVGKVWQEEMERHSAVHGGEIACGVYAGANGTVLQADANPDRVKDLGVWRQAAGEIAKEVGLRLKAPLAPRFRSTGFFYIKKAPDATPAYVIL